MTSGCCIPILMFMTKALPGENPNATEDEVKVDVSRNLGRCTQYVEIVEAAMAAKKKVKLPIDTRYS